MHFDEYLQQDAVGLAALVRTRQLPASALLRCALDQAAKANGRTNAIVRQWTPAEAPPGADGPFQGVPFLLKDGGHDIAGLPTTHGCRALASVIPTESSAVVQRFLSAGLVVFGKTNVPELLLKAFTDSRLLGRASNPWDPDRTPGGSSGGAAAAVASGVVPMAAAGDGGGSIRIPASYCGLFGLKSSRGRVSVGPAVGELWGGAATHGVISRSVRDSARALDVMQGAEPGDPFQIPPPALPYEAAIERPPGRLRIGFSTASPLGTPVHPEAQAAVHQAASLLQSLGHSVEEAAPEIDGLALARHYLTMYFGHVHATVLAARRQGASRSDFEMLTRVLATLGAATPSGRFVNDMAAWNGHARALARFHRQHDLLLTPPVASPAPRHGAADLPAAQAWVLDTLERCGLLSLLARAGLIDGLIQTIARDNLALVPFTQLANLTGTPAMSVPLHWSTDGLPVGVQFVAPLGQEDRLLQLARQLEQAQPWLQRLPSWVRG